MPTAAKRTALVLRPQWRLWIGAPAAGAGTAANPGGVRTGRPVMIVW
jgi:hypothetical protein